MFTLNGTSISTPRHLQPQSSGNIAAEGAEAGGWEREIYWEKKLYSGHDADVTLRNSHQLGLLAQDQASQNSIIKRCLSYSSIAVTKHVTKATYRRKT